MSMKSKNSDSKAVKMLLDGWDKLPAEEVPDEEAFIAAVNRAASQNQKTPKGGMKVRHSHLIKDEAHLWALDRPKEQA